MVRLDKLVGVVALALAFTFMVLSEPVVGQASIPTTVAVHVTASGQDIFAANEIVDTLNSIVNTSGNDKYILINTTTSPTEPVIAVGYGMATLLGLPGAELDLLGQEGFTLTSQSTAGKNNIVVSGSKLGPRGTLYGANHFLEAIGVKYVAQDVTILPPSIPGELPAGAFTKFTPGLEYREQYSTDCEQAGTRAGDFDLHRRLNKGSPGLDQQRGGQVVYAIPPGFVHTSYQLLGATNNQPPPDLFKEHNEWFWPRDDGTVYGQLCWSNQSLQEYVLASVLKILQNQPEATIISVSQNDNGNYCKSPEEMAIINAEGTPGGALFRAVNFIADGIKEDFPNVAIDTLAYQWSRPAPKITKPNANVIIRLCSIECNFGAPLTDPSNAAFQTDIVNWGKISNRTYIWNYITNFGHYLAPFPDWYSLGPNVKFYVDNGVLGIFQEGSYSGPGGDMAELKSYVLSKMMYDPTQDPDELINEFLDLYFGAAAAPFIRTYLGVMHDSVNATGFYMHENFDPNTAPFLTNGVILAAASAFKGALLAASGDQQVRVRCASMAIYYVALYRWGELVDFAHQAGVPWPLEPTMEAGFNSFALAFNETTERYGQAPAFREGGGPGNLTAFHEELFPKCPAGWVRSDSGVCGPACPGSGRAAKVTFPTNVSVSSFYKKPPTLSGSWSAASYPPQWIEFTLPSGSYLEGVTATVNMVPNGFASHTVTVDEEVVTTWSGNMTVGEVLTWISSKSLESKSVRITTTKSPSWVAWQSITFFSCTTY